jgi:hypothetical protein
VEALEHITKHEQVRDTVVNLVQLPRDGIQHALAGSQAVVAGCQNCGNVVRPQTQLRALAMKRKRSTSAGAYWR